jgi:hypothetical protein
LHYISLRLRGLLHGCTQAAPGKFPVARTRCWSTMGSTTLTLFFVTTWIVVSLQADHLDSGLDCAEPCHDRVDLMEAGLNEYTIQYTNIKIGPWGSCCIRPNQQYQILKNITTVGTENTKIIYSPGFILNEPYSNHLLVQYKIDCGVGRLGFFNVTDISLQGTTSNSRYYFFTECLMCSYLNSWCYDFIRINRGRAGTTEICDRIGSSNFLLQLESGNFTVTFRTSAEGEFPGFQMYIVCFEHQYHGMLLTTHYLVGPCHIQQVNSP